MASPVSPTAAAPRRWRKRTQACGRRLKQCLALPDPASEGAPPVAPPTGRNYRPDMGLPTGLPERSRRAFWARLYARRRLLSEIAAPFAPLHYALIGERRGYRPNAFFDPSYFRARAYIAPDATRGVLEAYLAHPEPNAPS